MHVLIMAVLTHKNLCDVCPLLQSFPPLLFLLPLEVTSYFRAGLSIFLLPFVWKLFRIC